MDRPASRLARRTDLRTEPVLKLGGVTVDPLSREAVYAGGRERLQPQTLKVLIALHGRNGGLVTRDELVEECWGGRIVGEDVINRCISLLRSFAARASGFSIETVPRCGYRLVVAREAKGAGPRWPAAVALLAAMAGLYFLHVTGGRAAAAPPTVALLPLTEDSHERGMHELALAARASLAEALADGGYPVALVAAGPARPEADMLVSGDVRRGASGIEAFIRVTDTHHDVMLYSHRFSGGEAPERALPDQIGASVAASLSWAASLMAVDRRHPSDPAIAAELLKAESLGGEADALRAYAVSRQMAAQVPGSAIAQLGFAFATGNALGELPLEQRKAAVLAGRVAAGRALKLAPEFGDSYVPWCSLHNPMLIGQCEDRLRKGVSVDPSAPFASAKLGALLNGVGRVDEALRFAQLSLASDPFQPSKLALVIRLLEEQSETSRADRLFRQATAWWPNDQRILWSRLVGIEAGGDHARLESFAGSRSGDNLPLDRSAAAELIAAARRHDRGRARRACAPATLRWTTQALCMTTLADLGETDAAFAIAAGLYPQLRGRTAADEERIWLSEPSAFSVAMLSSPAAAALRRDPRFVSLAASFGLLAYWRSGRLPDFCRKRHEPVCEQITAAR